MMAKKTIDYVAELEIVTCARCGTPFGVEQNRCNSLRKSHDSFYCPNGHSQYFGESQQEREIKRLEADLQESRAQRRYAENALEMTKRQKAAYKGQVTRIKNRVHKGICPVCNRQFLNLHRHMAGQHPDYLEVED
jgi:hypothetical protein